MKLYPFLAILLLLALLAPGCSREEPLGPDGRPVPKALKPIPPVKSTTNALEALQEARAELARLAAWARVAEEEARPGEAALFRAAVRSSEIQIRNFGNVVVKLHGSLPAAPTPPEIPPSSTRDNLVAARDKANLNQRTLYMGFLVSARKERCQEAVQAFDQAKQASAGLVTLYQKALVRFDAGGTSVEERDYVVCMVCGAVSEEAPRGGCPVCRGDATQFELIH
jgi:rubrerythrin